MKKNLPLAFNAIYISLHATGLCIFFFKIYSTRAKIFWLKFYFIFSLELKVDFSLVSLYKE